MEVSKKRRKREQKHAKGRVCTYAREGNNMNAEQSVPMHGALNGKTDINPDTP